MIWTCFSPELVRLKTWFNSDLDLVWAWFTHGSKAGFLSTSVMSGLLMIFDFSCKSFNTVGPSPAHTFQFWPSVENIFRHPPAVVT